MQKFLPFVFLFFLGIGADRLFSSYFAPQKIPAAAYTPIRQKGFTYISPLLYCETPEREDNQTIQNLSHDLQNYITTAQNDGLAKNVSVYFRTPDNGDWMVIDGEEKYTPASLLKVPTMMAYYKEAETDPNVLLKKLVFDQDIGLEETIKPSQSLEKGKSYTVDDLITRMITDSDNNANNVLLANLRPENTDRIFNEVDIGPLDYSKPEDFMTVKKYASFFRILYNASYLNRDMSEKALSLLTRVTFTKGLVVGVPTNIPVAHKFGERTSGILNTINQLHDCGIVYYPKHPYILCVMTRGYAFEDLEKVIQTISQKTYSGMDSMYTHKNNLRNNKLTLLDLVY